MSYKIAIASGKGGTGKTTVSVNLFKTISESLNNNVQLIDCDVEEPNAHFFFTELTELEESTVYQIIPRIDPEKCRFCKKCVSYCEFNAISIIPSVKYAEIDPSLCHSCGACLVACSDSAITEHPHAIGKVTNYDTGFGQSFTSGKLKIGSQMQTMMIGKTKAFTNEANLVTLYDSPPGTSCPVVETVANVDYVVLVTEPTPFGFHDLKLMIELLQTIEKPFGIVINKADLGTNEVLNYIEENNFSLLGKIPFAKDYAGKYASGELLIDIPERIQREYTSIANQLIQNTMEG